MKRLLILSLFLFGTLQSVEKISFFEDFSKYIDHEVTIRGFLYDDPSGCCVLSSEPNLRSCCIGKKGKQLYLEENPFGKEIYAVVTLKGVIKKKDGKYFLIDTEG